MERMILKKDNLLSTSSPTPAYEMGITLFFDFFENSGAPNFSLFCTKNQKSFFFAGRIAFG